MIEMHGKKFEEKEILKIAVTLNPGETSRLQGRGGSVTMLPFHGTAEGEIFTGKVLPGGVDTQVENLALARHMSARYMLEGTDCFGQACKIYIENNGWFTDGNHPSPFVTVPTFYTDSDRLADYLHTNQFITKGFPSDHNGPDIVIYQLIEITEDGSKKDTGSWMVAKNENL